MFYDHLSCSTSAGQARPISWAEQARLVPELPAHLQRMVVFAVNTGARDDNICRLRWE